MGKSSRFILGSKAALGLKSNLILISTVSLIACGGGGGGSSDNGNNGGGPTPPNTFSVETTMVKGLVSGANCELFEVDISGSKGASLALGTTVNGLADFGDSIEYQGTALIECTGGTYTDEATAANMIAPLLRAVVNLDGNTSTVVSPLTEIATQLAERANNLNSALTTHNTSVANALGFGGDIIATIPTDLTSFQAGINDAGAYGTLLAMISQLNANDAGSLSQLIDDLAADLANGEFSNTSLSDMGTALADLTALDSPIADNISPTIIANICLLYTSPSPRDQRGSRMPSSA